MITVAIAVISITVTLLVLHLQQRRHDKYVKDLKDGYEAKLTFEQERAYKREDELLDRLTLIKVEPRMAVVQAMPEPEGEVYISSTDDEKLAEHEDERRKLQVVPDNNGDAA